MFQAKSVLVPKIILQTECTNKNVLLLLQTVKKKIEKKIYHCMSNIFWPRKLNTEKQTDVIAIQNLISHH